MANYYVIPSKARFAGIAKWKEPAKSLAKKHGVLHLEHDVREVQKRIVDQTVKDSGSHAFAVLARDFRGEDYVNLKIVKAGRVFYLLGGDSDKGAFGGQVILLEILRGVKTRAGTEGCEQEFRRSHALVVATVFDWLIAHDEMLPRFHTELNITQMFDKNFH
jgi:hypothetical protein